MRLPALRHLLVGGSWPTCTSTHGALRRRQHGLRHRAQIAHAVIEHQQAF
jgi:hypothetical protein